MIKGILFVLITGTISHFIYDWSGRNFLLGFFFPTNESTWEHMKLSFLPMLIYSFYMNRKLRADHPCVTSALLSGTLLSTFLIPVLFYTYSGILGYHLMPLDISTFVVSVIVGFVAVGKLTSSCKMQPYTNLLETLIYITAICFILFTYAPPDIAIFAEPALHQLF